MKLIVSNKMQILLLSCLFMIFSGVVNAATEVLAVDGREIVGYIRFDNCKSLEEAKTKISSFADSQDAKYYYILSSGGEEFIYAGAVLMNPVRKP